MQKLSTGEQIRAARAARDWTQAELVQAVGVHGTTITTAYVSLIESDERVPSAAVCAALSAVLGVSLDDMLAPLKDGAPC